MSESLSEMMQRHARNAAMPSKLFPRPACTATTRSGEAPKITEHTCVRSAHPVDPRILGAYVAHRCDCGYEWETDGTKGLPDVPN